MRSLLLPVEILLVALLAPMPLALAGCSGAPPAALEFRIAEVEPGEGLEAFVHQDSGETFYLHPEVLIDEEDIATANMISQRGHLAIDLHFTDAGRDKFLQLTDANVGKRCGMIVYGRLLAAPIIRKPITQGRALIEGNFTLEEVQEIVSKLQLVLPGDR